MPSLDRRQRRRRRLTILVLGFFVLVGGVVGLWFVQQSRQAAYLDGLRDRGMAAYEAGDDAAAAALLEDYLAEEDENDADVLFAAADAVLRTPQPDNLHIAKARQWLIRLRVADPSHEPGKELVLEVANRYYPPTDAIAVANDILASDPDNAEALKLRAIKQARRDEFEPAAEDFAAYLELKPEDYEAQLLHLQVLNELHTDPQALVARAKLLVEEHPEDPRFEMVLGMTYAMGEDVAAAHEWVRSAATREPTDESFVLALTNAFDRLGLYGEASEYLVRVSETKPIDGELGLEVTRRLFEAGQFQTVLARLENLADDDLVESQAIFAMTLFERGERERAAEALNRLRSHPDEHGANWADALETFYAQPRVVADAIRAGETAFTRGLIHPYLSLMLGNLHAAVNDHTASITYQERASRLRPSWAAPLLMAAKDYLALEQWHLAEQMARQASVRRPDLIEAHVVRALAMGNDPQAARTGQLDEVLAYLERILERAPRTESLRVLQVRLLAANGDLEGAARAAGIAFREDPPFSAATLMQLADIGEDFKLGIEDAANQRIQSAYGNTPSFVFDQAIAKADAGQPDAGRAMLTAALDQAPEDIAWRLAMAQFLAHIGDPAATNAYANLAASHPDQLDLQVQLMRSGPVRADRELSNQLIERVRELAGEQSTQWRVERARWFLTGSDPQSDAARAEELLDEAIDGNPGDADAYLLRARAKELQGRLSQGLQDAQAAQRIRPDAPGLLLELVRFEQAVGNFDSALTHLLRIADHPAADAVKLRKTAALLAGQGEFVRAIELLESLQSRAGFGHEDRLLLAQLYTQAGRLRDAKWQVEQLLDANPTLETIAFGADFYAQLGELDNARAVLDRLTALGLDEAQLQAAKADFASRYEAPELAAERFANAAQADPTDPAGWLRLAAFHLSRGDADAALHAAQTGRAAVGEEPGLDALIRRVDDARFILEQDRTAAPLLAAMLGDPAFRDAAEDAVRFIGHALRSGDAEAEVVTGLRRRAEQHPDFLPLQLVSAERLLRARQFAEAQDLTTAAVLAFPKSVDAARLQTAAYSADNLWDQALVAAREWRKRGAGEPLAAEIAVARAQVRMGRTSAAIETLEPYRAAVEANPAPWGMYAQVLGEALVRQRRVADAQALLQPHIREHGAWRMAWMRLASQHLEEPAARRRWLEAVTNLVPAAAPAERFALAEAWWLLHLAAPDTQGDRIAGTILQRLVASPDATDLMWFLHAVVEESAGRIDTASEAYRKVIEINPESTIARNNLAMLLVDFDTEPNAGQTALALARRVVADDPNNANFRDTLAHVQAKLGQLDEAIANIQIAIDLEPQNPVWRERLAELLQRSSNAESFNATTPSAGVSIP